MVVGELTQERDVVIIGGGPGGYHAAIRAAQLGMQVTLIEKKELGGMCLNAGCIPSKIHTSAAQAYQKMTSLKNLGIDISGVSFDITELQKNKKKVISQLNQGIKALCKANKVEVIYGEASFLSAGKIGVENGHQYDTYTFTHAVIAAGSRKIPILDIEDQAFSPITIWNLEELPQQLIIYGNDDISLEAATTFNALGSEVTLLLPPGQNEFTFDTAINKELSRQLKKKKIKVVKLSNQPEVKQVENGWEVTLTSETSTNSVITGSHFYIAQESKPNLQALGVQRAGIDVDNEGCIEINERCQTNVNNIYAIGDITDGPALAAKAIKQGKVAAENIAGQNSEYDLTFMPRVLQTIPPIASSGLTEGEAVELGLEVKVGESSLQSNGYASVTNQKDGFVKTISDKNTEQILGVHMFGTGAVEHISTSTIALEMVAREEDFLFAAYPHPSINESMLESVEDLIGMAVHKVPAMKKQKVSTT
jgi:dihydrolipoamide dehydrogenase